MIRIQNGLYPEQTVTIEATQDGRLRVKVGNRPEVLLDPYMDLEVDVVATDAVRKPGDPPVDKPKLGELIATPRPPEGWRADRDRRVWLPANKNKDVIWWPWGKEFVQEYQGYPLLRTEFPESVPRSDKSLLEEVGIDIEKERALLTVERDATERERAALKAQLADVEKMQERLAVPGRGERVDTIVFDEVSTIDKSVVAELSKKGFQLRILTEAEKKLQEQAWEASLAGPNVPDSLPDEEIDRGFLGPYSVADAKFLESALPLTKIAEEVQAEIVAATVREDYEKAIKSAMEYSAAREDFEKVQEKAKADQAWISVDLAKQVDARRQELADQEFARRLTIGTAGEKQEFAKAIAAAKEKEEAELAKLAGEDQKRFLYGRLYGGTPAQGVVAQKRADPLGVDRIQNEQDAAFLKALEKAQVAAAENVRQALRPLIGSPAGAATYDTITETVKKALEGIGVELDPGAPTDSASLTFRAKDPGDGGTVIFATGGFSGTMTGRFIDLTESSGEAKMWAGQRAGRIKALQKKIAILKSRRKEYYQEQSELRALQKEIRDEARAEVRPLIEAKAPPFVMTEKPQVVGTPGLYPIPKVDGWKLSPDSLPGSLNSNLFKQLVDTWDAYRDTDIFQRKFSSREQKFFDELARANQYKGLIINREGTILRILVRLFSLSAYDVDKLNPVWVFPYFSELIRMLEGMNLTDYLQRETSMFTYRNLFTPEGEMARVLQRMRENLAAADVKPRFMTPREESTVLRIRDYVRPSGATDTQLGIIRAYVLMASAGGYDLDAVPPPQLANNLELAVRTTLRSIPPLAVPSDWIPSMPARAVLEQSLPLPPVGEPIPVSEARNVYDPAVPLVVYARSMEVPRLQELRPLEAWEERTVIWLTRRFNPRDRWGVEIFVRAASPILFLYRTPAVVTEQIYKLWEKEVAEPYLVQYLLPETVRQANFDVWESLLFRTLGTRILSKAEWEYRKQLRRSPADAEALISPEAMAASKQIIGKFKEAFTSPEQSNSRSSDDERSLEHPRRRPSWD